MVGTPRSASGFLESVKLPHLPHHILHLRQEEMFERRRERDGRIERRNANDGTVKILEGLFIDNGGDLAGKTTGLGVFVEKNDFVGLLHTLDNEIGRASCRSR